MEPPFDPDPPSLVVKIERSRVDRLYRAKAYGRNQELVWWTEGYTERKGALHACALAAESGQAFADALPHRGRRLPQTEVGP